MKITEARIEMADGTEVFYIGGAADMPSLPQWPMLAIHVEDMEAAREVIETLERSRARKKAGEKDEPAKEPPAPQWGYATGDLQQWHLWWPDSSEAACGATSDAEIVFADPVEGSTAVCYRCARRAGPKADRKRNPAEVAPGPVKEPPDDPPCPAHADGRHVRTGGAPCACEPASPDAVTPPAVGKTRAHRIREGVEGETGKVVA